MHLTVVPNASEERAEPSTMIRHSTRLVGLRRSLVRFYVTITLFTCQNLTASVLRALSQRHCHLRRIIKIFGAPGRPARSRECKSLTVKV